MDWWPALKQKDNLCKPEYHAKWTGWNPPMEPAIKTQVMDKDTRLINSLASSKIFDETDPESRSVTRQEFALEADINYLVDRFTPGSPQRPYTYGETDYTMDLQGAFTAIQVARHMHSRLPPDLRKEYPTWQSLLNAVETGEFKAELLDRERERAPKGPDSQPDTTSPGESEVDGVSHSGTPAKGSGSPTSRRSTHKASEE